MRYIEKISIQQYKTDMGFKSLVEGVQDNIFVIPEYQRKYRWTKEQVEELATSSFGIYQFHQSMHSEMKMDSLKFWMVNRE